MSLTVKKLKEFLANMPDDVIIRDQQNQDFVHILCEDEIRLSTEKPIGYCSRSGGYVYPSVVGDYSAFSPELDEDLYDLEWEPFTKEELEKRENWGKE